MKVIYLEQLSPGFKMRRVVLVEAASERIVTMISSGTSVSVAPVTTL